MTRVSWNIPVLIVAVTAGALAQQPAGVKMAESGIRRVATATRVPEYPAASLKQKRSGVAVARIVSQPDGRIATVTVLEAPDDAISAAVHTALMKWTIPPVTIAGRPEQGVSGKVTFYFQIANGRGRVLSPEEMPGGPNPEPAGGPPARGPGAGPPPASGGAPGVKPPPSTTVSHSVPAEIEIGEAELQRIVSEKPTVLDIREREDFKRGHRPGAVNIPRDELVARAGIELDRSRAVVIDCSQSETQDCRNVANALIRAKRYPKVLIFLP